MNMRQRNALLTKEKIYNAAISLFEEKGYENTSIEDITTLAGTAKGSFYTYYKSKNDLVYHTVEVFNEVAINSYEEASTCDTFEKQLLKFIELLYKGVEDVGKEILKALYRNNIVDASTQVVNDMERDIYTSVAKIVDYGLKTGELSDKNSRDFYLRKIIIPIMGIDYYWCCSEEKIEIVELATSEIKVLLDGLMAVGK